MGKVIDAIKKANRTRWQNTSKVHQLIYDRQGMALNVCVGAVIIPTTDEDEAWWKEKLRRNRFFEPVGSIRPPGFSVPASGLPTGSVASGTVNTGGATAQAGTQPALPASMAQDAGSRRFVPDLRPADEKGGMGLRKSIDGMVEIPEGQQPGTLVERQPVPNPNIPPSAEEMVSTGRRGRTRRLKAADGSAAGIPDVIGGEPIVGPGGEVGGGGR